MTKSSDSRSAEKPVSLKPLSVKEAVGDLLALSPKDVAAIKAATAPKKRKAKKR